jgi:mRNA interferase YafQ
MREVMRMKKFLKDYRQVQAGISRDILNHAFEEAVELLACDRPLPEKFHDHALQGEYRGYRDCHIRPDLVLIYKKMPGQLHLYRLGSYSHPHI